MTLVKILPAPITGDGHGHGTVWTDGHVFGELAIENDTSDTRVVTIRTGVGSVTFAVPVERVEVVKS